jgi:exopolyphosphatase/pppGpp-phosphohydrolase
VPRLGAVDIGTNSTRLLAAEVDGELVTPLVRRAKVTRLGEGVDAARRLLPAAVARVHSVLAEYRDELELLRVARSRSARAPSATPPTAPSSCTRSAPASASKPGSSPATRKRR